MGFCAIKYIVSHICNDLMNGYIIKQILEMWLTVKSQYKNYSHSTQNKKKKMYKKLLDPKFKKTSLKFIVENF